MNRMLYVEVLEDQFAVLAQGDQGNDHYGYTPEQIQKNGGNEVIEHQYFCDGLTHHEKNELALKARNRAWNGHEYNCNPHSPNNVLLSEQ